MGSELIGRTIKDGRYKLIDERGNGNFGTVYIARDTLTNYLYAAKVMRMDHTDDNELVERFKREAVILYNLNDLHIGRVIDYGNEGQLYYIIMHHIDGQNLKYYIQNYGNMEPLRALDYIHQAAQGLDAAYKRGVVHRDIKPQNILINNKGILKIVDFGLSRSKDMPTLTHSDKFMGTAYYAAPEQVLSSHEVDTRADLYALSAMLFEMLTGKPPYSEGNALEIIMQHTRAEIPSICRRRPDLPPEMDIFFQKTLAKSPGARFQTPAEYISAIEQLQQRFRGEVVQPPQAPHIIAQPPQTPRIVVQPPQTPREVVQPAQALREASRPIQLREAVQPPQIPRKTPQPPEVTQPAQIARLILLGNGQIFPLHATQVIVGRPDPRREIHPDVMINDETKTVGRIHACLSCQQGIWSVEDRDSRNKTRLNGEILIPFTPKPLKDGDLLRFGRVEARFELR